MQLNINGKTIEISDEDLSKAIEEKVESFEVKAEGFTIRTSEEEESYKTNLINEGQTRGFEIGRKDLLKGLGVEGEGFHKSNEKSLEAINGLISNKVASSLDEAKIEPDKKVKELTSDLEKVRAILAEKDNKIQEISGNFEGFKKKTKKVEKLKGLIPDNVILPKSDIISLMETKFKTDLNEKDQLVGFGADGNMLKDSTTMSPLTGKDVVNVFFENNPQFLKKAEGGRGDGDNPGAGGKQTLEQFTKEMNEEGHATNGAEFNRVMNERLKNGTLQI
jgi:ribosomal protein S13